LLVFLVSLEHRKLSDEGGFRKKSNYKCNIGRLLMRSTFLIRASDKEAGYQRKPAVNYFTAAAFDRNPDLRQWPPVTRGVEEGGL